MSASRKKINFSLILVSTRLEVRSCFYFDSEILFFPLFDFGTLWTFDEFKESTAENFSASSLSSTHINLSRLPHFPVPPCLSG